MTDDIGTIIEGIMKIISLGTSTIPRVPQLVSMPITTKIESVKTQGEIVSMMENSVEEMQKANDDINNLAKKSGKYIIEDRVYEEIRKEFDKYKEDLKKKEQESLDKAKKIQEKNKSKMQAIMDRLQKIADGLNETNKQIDKLKRKKSKIKEKYSKLKEDVQIADDEEDKALKKEKDDLLENAKKNKVRITAAQMIELELKRLQNKKRKLLKKQEELRCRIGRMLALNDENTKLGNDSVRVKDLVMTRISEFPKCIIDTIPAIVDYIEYLQTGQLQYDDEDFDLKKILDEIKKLVGTVEDKIKNLPIPEVPVLSDIAKIIDVLKKMSEPITPMTEEEIKQKVPELPSIPSVYINSISQAGWQMTTMSLQIIWMICCLVWDMLSSIVDLFKLIAGVLGVPEIPYPLTLIEDVKKALPDIGKLMKDVPKTMMNSLKNICAKQLQAMAAMQIPDVPDINAVMAQGCEICPEHIKEMEEEKIKEEKEEEERLKAEEELEAKKKEEAKKKGEIYTV